jgi:hypothetical protein
MSARAATASERVGRTRDDAQKKSGPEGSHHLRSAVLKILLTVDGEKDTALLKIVKRGSRANQRA